MLITLLGRHVRIWLVVGLMLFAWAAAVPAQTIKLSGIVRDPDGEPVRGATVVAGNERAQPASFTATSDDKGRFAMWGLQGGVWRFLATAPGFETALLEIDISALKRNAPVEIQLVRTPLAPAWLGGATTREIQMNLQAAEALLQGGRPDDAIAAYRKILARTPSLTAINLQIGDAYRRKKDYDAALAAYRALLAAEPANERATMAIAATEMERGNLPAAEAALAPLADSPAASRDVCYLLGEVKFAAGQLDEAAASYRRAAALDAAWVPPTYKLGLIAFKQGDLEAARRLLEQVIAASPDSPEASEARLVVAQMKK